MKTAAQQKGFTLIELLVVIGILAILFSIVLIAINPSRQFNQANDTKRRSDTIQILNAIHEYAAENSGNLPTNMPAKGHAAVDISSAAGNADICAALVTKYISALPADPGTNAGAPVTDCAIAGGYTTGYQVAVDADGRVTISAPNAALGTVAVTR
jgi:type IV pilus assembly protein PilA